MLRFRPSLRLRLAIVPAALLALASCGSSPSTDDPTPSVRKASDQNSTGLLELPEIGLAEMRQPADWQAWIARDRLLSFPSRTTGRAVAEVRDADTVASRRAVALMAVGCAGLERERSRLESWALEGGREERRAAILALGELPTRNPGVLVRLADGSPGDLPEHALLALLRSGSAEGRRYVETLAGLSDQPHSAAARRLLAFDADPRAETEVSRTLYELRWEAARRYGLVDGQAWSTQLVMDLARDQEFLDAVVYRAASELRLPGVRDHYLELLLTGEGPARIRGCANSIPTQLDEVFARRLWSPETPEEWTALVDELGARGLESQAINVLRAGRLIDHLRLLASGLLVRAGNAEGLPLLELDLQSRDPIERSGVAEALSGTGLRQYVEDLERLRKDDESGRVRMSALVGMARLGHAQSREELRSLFYDPEHPDHDELIDALVRARRDSTAVALMTELVPSAKGRARLRLTTALLLADRFTARDAIREALRSKPVRGAEGVEMVRALGRSPQIEDLELLDELFPVEDDLEVNIELGLALLRNRQPGALQFLRFVLWQDPFHRSVLAGALMVEIDGIQTLHQELARPPLGASEQDLRRVGFALGEWGSFRDVEALTDRRRSTDPAVQGALLGVLTSRTR